MDPKLLDVPIIPMEGLAGVKIGQSRKVVVAKLGEPNRVRLGAEGYEFLHYHGVTVCLRQGLAYEIVAEEGYRGRTREGVNVGATWHELRKIHPNITFHEDERLWYVPGIDGLSFDLVRPPRSEEQPINPPWVDEEYEVLDPNHAFVRSIAVHQIQYDSVK